MQRDNIERAEAQATVDRVLLIYEHAQATTLPTLSPERRAHLRRSALAELWLTEVFEPHHPATAIPSDFPALTQARKATVHPKIHVVCQLVAVPAQPDQDVNDPTWRAKVRERFDPVAERMRRYLPEGASNVCTLMTALLPLERRIGPDVVLRVESSGFDLNACAELDDDGTCLRPRFDPTWTEAVSQATPGHFLPPFDTRFGRHLVYLHNVLPSADADDPAVDLAIREQTLSQWRQEQLEFRLQQLRAEAAVLVAATSETP